jgi:hypothetical protein
VDHLYVNTTRTAALTIDFDISFHDLSCSLLSVDAMDDTGMAQTDVIHELYKHRLSPHGTKEGIAEKINLGDTIIAESQLEALVRETQAKDKVIREKIGPCGNCYGAGGPGQCCQTCDDVKRAYEKLGWNFKPQGILQCQSESYLTTMKEQFAEDGGCQLFGRLELNKNSGHFHIAPHKKLHQPPANENGMIMLNLMDLLSFTFDQFNVTHTINSLSFGEQYPGIKSPLDSQQRIVSDTHGMYQYYIKVVPTKYKGLNTQTVIESNQYSVTEHLSHLAPGSGRGLPGVYFYYEVSPIQAYIEERRSGSLWRFLTSVCAIVGGAFSMMGLLDVLLSNFFAFIQPGYNTL